MIDNVSPGQCGTWVGLVADRWNMGRACGRHVEHG